MQGRGLKPASETAAGIIERVAPYAGAWIETALLQTSKQSGEVAPYAGAWIETETCLLIP